ncbi:thiamine phosphate synthase [Porphyromonas sp. COT-239 OH1446]|uniref:thiamine phosphate synthase n=1 Tax=Porphyromonas sp. COT-239 OH1446 TaxID=1515613 RepID=UPI000692407F|nr:thiamine phosphate synthase [Porphyromonas sp. COT-239 OH1446]
MLIAITPERLSAKHLSGYNKLLALGLRVLHLRLPGGSRSEYEEAILAIEPRYRSRIMISDHYDLVPKAGLRGIHLSRAKVAQWDDQWRIYGCLSVSAHSLEELEGLPFTLSYALVGPVFPSQSKSGYAPHEDWLDKCEHLRSLPYPLVALSGITPERLRLCLRKGFAAGATLGYLAEDPERMVERWQEFDRPCILSIAGHDPCTGAGITADCLTIEAAGGRALSLVSSLTSQHEEHFAALHPISLEETLYSLEVLLERYTPLSAKIGMTSSLGEAISIARRLRTAGVRHIIWDPILKASRGNAPLHATLEAKQIEEMLRLVSLTTPNLPEAQCLWGDELSPELLSELANRYRSSILLKGGHTEEAGPGHPLLCRDLLFEPGKPSKELVVSRSKWDKHGTGCKLSSLIATHLAQLEPLDRACRMAQLEVDRYIRSSPSLYGLHLGQEPREHILEHLRHCRLMYITDSSELEELLSKAQAALEGGVRWIQLRMKGHSYDERLSAALALKTLMQSYSGSILIINDDVEVALAADADGVHLGLSDCSPLEARERLGSGRIIGGTCNSIEDLHQRALEGVDYVGLGPYRMTRTKQRLAPILGDEGLEDLVRCSRGLPHPLPLWAIGGIEPSDIAQLSRLGLQGIALSGAINHAHDLKQASQELLQELDKHFGS